MGYTEQDQEEERLFEDTYVAVNRKTKEILALEVTDEKIHDGNEMKTLVDRVLERNYKKNIKSKQFWQMGGI